MIYLGVCGKSFGLCCPHREMWAVVDDGDHTNIKDPPRTIYNVQLSFIHVCNVEALSPPRVAVVRDK